MELITGTYTAQTAGLTAANYNISYNSTTLTVVQEDAGVTYTGPLSTTATSAEQKQFKPALPIVQPDTSSAYTGSLNTNANEQYNRKAAMAIVQPGTNTDTRTVSANANSAAQYSLKLTVQITDSTLLNLGDTHPGNITQATVTVVDRTTGKILLNNLRVTAANKANTIGTASATITGTVTKTTTFTYGFIVGGCYYRNSTNDNAVVTVVKTTAPRPSPYQR